MSESSQNYQEPSEASVDAEDSAVKIGHEAASPSGAPPARPSVFADPVVRLLAWMGALFVSIFLAAVISVLVLGLINPLAPRTALEQQLSVTGTAVEAGSLNPETWSSYIDSLIASGQLSRAQRVIDEAREADIEDPAKQYFLVAQVRLDLERAEYEKALEHSDAAIEALRAQLAIEEELYQATKQPSVMIAEGLGESYGRLLINRAEAYEALGQTQEAIASLDEYITDNKTAADILVWRGDLKSASGDKDGAAADYQEASQFMPGDDELARKLTELGVGNE